MDPESEMRSEIMRRKSRKFNKKAGAGKLVQGLLLGSVLGATVGWLTAPARGEETRRHLAGNLKSVRERLNTAENNVESQARELAEDVKRDTLPTAG
jgi:gas vesicle protein